MEREQEEDDDNFFGIYKVSGNKRYRKLLTILTVGGKALEFEVDTGAELSAIPACLYHVISTHSVTLLISGVMPL